MTEEALVDSKTLFTLERETEQAERAEESAKMTQRIAELSEQLSVSEISDSRSTAGNCTIDDVRASEAEDPEYQPDPQHEAVRRRNEISSTDCCDGSLGPRRTETR